MKSDFLKQTHRDRMYHDIEPLLKGSNMKVNKIQCVKNRHYTL